jgi:nucleotide-binding universal stress UspA family protein
MFKTIVLALDGSHNAKEAMPYAVGLAREEGARVVLVHVDQRIAAKGDMPAVHPDEKEIRVEIERQTEALSEQGIDATLRTATIAVGGPRAHDRRNR